MVHPQCWFLLIFVHVWHPAQPGFRAKRHLSPLAERLFMTLCLRCTTEDPACRTSKLHLQAFCSIRSDGSFQACQALSDRGSLAYRSNTQLLCCHRLEATVNSQQHHGLGLQGFRAVCWCSTGFDDAATGELMWPSTLSDCWGMHAQLSCADGCRAPVCQHHS